jgi:hydrogenase expression/formation protein HypC
MCLAVPGKLLETEEVGDNRLGVVELAGVKRQVFLDCVPEAMVGDYVLVHAGFAISRMEEKEARETSALLERIGMIEAALPEGSEIGENGSAPLSVPHARDEHRHFRLGGR